MRLFLALLLVCTLPAVEEARHPLVGTTWAIVIVSPEGDKTEDVLTFDGATLASQAYAASRFVPGPVTVGGKDGAYTVEAILAEPRGRQLLLKGTVAGQAITGTIAVGVLGQYERSTFSGTKK